MSLLVYLAVPAVSAFAQCSSPANAIVAENCLTGNPVSEWQISGAGDLSIQGFATDISVNAGSTISFKINTTASAYTINIYRLGYYGGMGARKVASVTPSATLPQTQPACLIDATTMLSDCGNWAVSASWAVPSTAVSGYYVALLTRSDTGGSSHIYFIVRNDSSHSAILFQAADETWVAYNDYGGHSLYGVAGEFNLAGRGLKVSYNRPFDTRNFQAPTFLFNGEYPMIRWLEANGYDVTYFTGVDAERNGSLIKNHKVYLSVGHDEYWSGGQRTNVEAARNAGVHLGFFSGNEVFWKTRWENSIDGSNTAYRTMVCYKETLGNAVSDPADPPTWTGTWRDSRFSPPADGGRPENGLTGTLFIVNGPGVDNTNLSIQVPADDGQMRFWRNTSVATLSSGQIATMPAGTLGYEWDTDSDNGSRPAGLFHLATATYPMTVDLLLDYGGVYGAGNATHNMTMYRAASGALVFSAGTVQWAWGLDDTHDGTGGGTDVRMQQATVNLFADMGVQPGNLQAGLVPATQSADTVPPISTISSPASGSSVTGGTAVTISGTAADSGGGVVGGVEVSVDGGQTWHMATGRSSWSYSWTPKLLGATTVLSRAVDDSGNLQTSASSIAVTVIPHDCPCQLWSSSALPSIVDSGDGNPIEVGVKFQADYNGDITGIRFYKAAANTGPHVGHLWTASGTLLATVTFTNETASGWQQATFSSPVTITANTVYVASYFAPVGHYSASGEYFALSGVDNPPLHYPGGGSNFTNGVFNYGSSAFPAQSYNSTNYWVDVLYSPSSPMPGAPSSLVLLPSSLSFAGYKGQANPAPQTVALSNQGTATLSWTATSSASWLTVSPASGTAPSTLTVSVNTSSLASGTYTGTITVTAPGAANTPQVIPVTLVVSSLLLSSTFSSGTMDGWTSSPLGLASNWSVSGQALVYNGGGHTQVYAGNSAWTDYTVQAGIKLATLNDYPGGIRGRVNPSTGAAYTVWLYPHEGLLKLYRNTAWNIDSGIVLLGQGSVDFDVLNFHTVALSFSGSSIQVSYDGTPVITATDSTYTSGMVALDVSNQVITFDNVLATSTSTMPSATLALAPSTLSFSGTYQGASPAAQNVQLSQGGTGTTVWSAASSASWLTVSPASGAGAGTLQVSVNSSQLSAGTYSGTIQITSFGTSNSPQTINVGLSVTVPPPVLAVAPASMSFTWLVGQAAPAAQGLAVTNGGTGALSWTASSDSSWLTISAASGSTPGALNAGINTTGLAAGTYTGHVTISSAGVSNSPVSVPVTLTVMNQDLAETFGNAAAGWVISPMGLASGWSVSNGSYTFNGSGLSQSCAGNSAWANYTFDTTVKLSNLSNWPGGVRGRVNPSTGAGYAVWLYPGTSKAILYRVGQWDINGSTLVSLGQATLSFDTSAHDLQMVFQGSQISVYWDGTLLITASDSNYASGYVCMDADSQPITYSNVRVSSLQGAVTVTAAPTSAVFSASPGYTPPSQNITVSAGGAATTFGITVSPSGSWLSAAASASLTPGTITLSVNATGLAAGTYTGSVTVYAPGATGSPLVIPVTLGVKSALLSVTPSALNFFAATGSSPAGQTINIANAGTGSLSWTASADSSWITLSSTSGTAPKAITVSINPAGLTTGQYQGNITIASNDVSNGPITVPVNLQLGTQQFTDTFSSASNWTISPMGNASGWSVAGGFYTYNGTGASQSWAGSSSWTDYTVATDFKLTVAQDYPGGLRGRVNTTTGSGYGAWIYPTEGVVKLFRIGQWNIDADNSLLAQAGSLSITAGTTHNLRLSFRGSRIQVYFDQTLIIDVTDTSYTQGAIALDGSNQVISFANVGVIGY